MFRNKSQGSNERVVVDGRIVDVAALRDEARQAGTRFWVLLVLVSMISSMVVPYLSMASVVAEDSKVFDSQMVIPGYSMGGIDISAYGVDINSWGQTGTQSASNPSIVQSTYGYWTPQRAADASRNLVASQRADKGKNSTSAPLDGYSVDDAMMDGDKKARGWIGITRDGGEGTGLSDFTSDPNGVAISNRSNYSESVAPYRTQEDWKYWDSRTVGGTETSMTATIYPDFVIFGWNAATQTARVLGNPDSIENPATSTSGQAATGAIRDTMAIPVYVPLSTLFSAYGLGDSVMGDDGMNDMQSLLDAIGKDAREHGGKATKLNAIVRSSSDAKNNLLVATHYDNLNGANRSSESGSDAWNPYPYSMVFSATAGSSTIVSSIYNNTEAYVYFSPQSVYNNYIALRSEYDDLVSQNATAVAAEDPMVSFQLGYYLAGMSILEAYLNEALPQDMTRGYVGPAEGNPIAGNNKVLANDKKLDTRSGDSNTVASLFRGSLGSVDGGDSALGFKTVAYSQLMYDFADSAIVKFKQKGSDARLGMTSAIMNTLSTYGYGTRDSGVNVNTSTRSAGQGPNRGMTRRQAMAKVTSFGPYSDAADSIDVSGVSAKDDPLLHPDSTGTANAGLYVPGYYPVQQHEMPISEMAYRFQVVSDIPYETLTHELALYGFSSNVSLSYKNNAIEGLAQTKNYYNKSAALGKQLNDLDTGGDALSLAAYDESESIILNPEKQATMVNEEASVVYADEKDLTTRVDNAFLAFKQGRMNADNVHDLVDIVRAIPGTKYETFMRYYNPLKSSGGADDVFLTRVTPAQTSYMPKMLTAGYESAGGTTNNSNVVMTSNANFDYFSIPSLGPCLAAKTAENTFYGALNYELRPFYTEGFLSSLPANANVPALERYETLTGGDGDVETATSIDDIKDKVTTIYVLAKRLAFAEAYGAIMDAQDGSEGTVSLGALHYADLQSNVVASKNLSAIKAALNPNDTDRYIGQENDDGSNGLLSVKTNKTVTKKTKKKKETATVGKGAQAIVDAAELVLNSTSRYSYGGNPFAKGTTVAEVGMVDGVLQMPDTDCSGLVSFCLAQTGLTNKRYSSHDFPNDSDFVKTDDPQPGDVAWWDGHVAIYVGNDTVIEHLHSGLPPARNTGRNPSCYYHFKKLDGTGAAVATAIAGLASGVAQEAVAKAFLTASGDLVTTTGEGGSSQRTAYYDDGEGTSTAVAYVCTESGWTVQAESTQTASPSIQTTGGNHADATVNGIPVSYTPSTSVSSVPPVSLANGYNHTDASPASAASNATTSDAGRNDGGSQSSSSSSSNRPSGSSATTVSEAVAEDDSPYADNGGEADQIYINDHLAAKGFLKADASQWEQAKGTHGVGDSITFHIPRGMTFSTTGDFDYVMQKFGPKHIISDELLAKRTIWCKDSNGYAFVTTVRTLFSGLYNDAFNTLLVPSGTYYWDTPKNVASYGGDLDGVDAKDDEKVEYNTVAMEYAKAGNSGVAKETIDEYCKDAFGEAASIWRNMKALNDELPQQMQNVLAWADAQTTTESEQNYKVDETEANLVITIGNKRVNTPNIGIIRSLADLQSAQFEIADNNGDWTAVPVSTDDEGNAEDDLQSRMVRGVAGTTATASGSLAAYTISATVGRTDALVSSNSSANSIPYSGICSGNLTSGADRYAQLQSHAIDYEGIASRSTGDLRSRSTAGTNVIVASATTDARTQQAIGKVGNIVGELKSSSVPQSVETVKAAFGSVSSGGDARRLQTVSTANAGSLIAGTPAAKQTMAMASTFSSATMNRRSAASQKADTATGLLVASGSSAMASADDSGALTSDRNTAQALVDGTFSDAYAVIQSIALIIVLVSLMAIAFQNFVGYTTGSEAQYITAQTQLKTVLPRALIAVAMIGLPPIGGGLGFQGGCFLLLQMVNAIMDSILGVFTQGASTTELMNEIGKALLQDNIDGSLTLFNILTGIDLFAIVIGVVSYALFLLGSAVVTLLITATNILLFAFWALGPIMWAFYTWPYSGSQKPTGKGMLSQVMKTITGRMGFKMISGKSMGNEAPSGWLLGYIGTLSTVAAWNIMFWVAGIAYNYVRPSGSLQTGATADSHVATSSMMSAETGEEFVNQLPGFFDTSVGGLLIVIVFLLLVYLMFIMLKNAAGGAVGNLYRGIGGTLSTIREYAGVKAGELATVSESDRRDRIAHGFATRHLSTSTQDKLAKAMTSDTAVAVGTVSRIANAGAHDVGRRMRLGAENLARPVAQRKESSGAFDNLITVSDSGVYLTAALSAPKGIADEVAMAAGLADPEKLKKKSKNIHSQIESLTACDNDGDRAEVLEQAGFMSKDGVDREKVLKSLMKSLDYNKQLADAQSAMAQGKPVRVKNKEIAAMSADEINDRYREDSEKLQEQLSALGMGEDGISKLQGMSDDEREEEINRLSARTEDYFFNQTVTILSEGKDGPIAWRNSQDLPGGAKIAFGPNNSVMLISRGGSGPNLYTFLGDTKEERAADREKNAATVEGLQAEVDGIDKLLASSPTPAQPPAKP